jgi:hypothetical protein
MATIDQHICSAHEIANAREPKPAQDIAELPLEGTIQVVEPLGAPVCLN